MRSILRIGVSVVGVAVAFAMIAGGCASHRKSGAVGSGTDEDKRLEPVTRTEWRLVEFQSMSDEVGTVRPDDPPLYTMSLEPDGAVSLRMNCNRGNGTWSATPSSPAGGNIEFGPIAATRALCPPPSLDEQLARDLGFVRSYTIEGERLFLSLMADGGIYVWERVGAR